MFQAAYESAWHHPGAAWASALAVLVAVALRPRSPLAKLAALLAAVSALDAWCSGALSPPLSPSSPLRDLIPVAFVIAGDQRFFYLVARQTRRRPEAFAISLGLALVVPVGSYSAYRGAPSLVPSKGVLFLVYEIAFAVVALAALLWIRRRFADAPALLRWLTGLALFELVQYSGWALADVVILAGRDAGYLLRIAPNLLYYAVFVPFAWATAPKEAHA